MIERNIEEIRRKNLEDNQLFLDQLRMSDIRNNFVDSARSILREHYNTKKPIENKKILYRTRYNLKVKAGEIPPHIPEWKQKIQSKLLAKEEKQKLLAEEEKQKLLAKEEQQKLNEERLKMRRKKRYPSRRIPPWMWSYRISRNSYHRVFKPRQTKIGERIKQELKESLEQNNS